MIHATPLCPMAIRMLTTPNLTPDVYSSAYRIRAMARFNMQQSHDLHDIGGALQDMAQAIRLMPRDYALYATRAGMYDFIGRSREAQQDGASAKELFEIPAEEIRKIHDQLYPGPSLLDSPPDL